MRRSGHPRRVPGKKVRILIVDDHPLVREGLIARLTAEPDMDVCGAVSDVDDALARIQAAQPDLVIVDIALGTGSGLDLITKVVASGSTARMLVVSAYDEALFAERALCAGAHGYINKQELQGKVIEGVRAVLRGERYLSNAMTQLLVNRAVQPRRSRSQHGELTPRELRVFDLIGRGLSTREIAERLVVSIHTIESHREHIRAKLNLRNGSELLQRAMRWRIENP